MGFLAALISTALCAVVYVRMYRRELPKPMGKKQAVVPVVLGFFSVFLASMLVLAIGLAIHETIGSIGDVVTAPVPRALISSFLLAGFTEEFVKFLVFLLVVRLSRPKNVYEYGMLCAGVGFGFTALEDLIYGRSPVASFFRILFFTMHMMFGLLMGTHLGLAKYSRQQGSGGAGTHLALAFVLPILWHTLFDAVTTLNPAIHTEENTVLIGGLIAALVVLGVSIALQFVLLIRFRKKTADYCNLRLGGSGNPEAREEEETIPAETPMPSDAGNQEAAEERDLRE